MHTLNDALSTYYGPTDGEPAYSYNYLFAYPTIGSSRYWLTCWAISWATFAALSVVERRLAAAAIAAS